MKEWLIKNSGISEEEYDKIINCDKDLTIDDTSDEYILSNKDSLLMYDIMNFTLDKNYKKDEFVLLGDYYSYKGISFSLLSDFFPDETLLSEERFGKCHTASYSMAICSSLDLLTLMCTDFQSGKDFLHTVLLIQDTDEIIDYTLNIIMNKQLYFRLMNARIIKYISNEKIKMIDNNIRKSTSNVKKNINVKELLCFPDEINNLVLK